MRNAIDRLTRDDFGLRGLRLGLITSATGLTMNLVPTVDVLRERGFDLRALFAPEHGIRGEIGAGDAVETTTDPDTGLPVYSVYGGDCRPAPETLAGLDALLIDIQDAGSRFYTYISTMYNAMEACAAASKTFVVLDRLNPIGGTAVEGNILDPAFRSFVGIAPIPQRHGMTMGELARFFNAERGINCDLRVVPLEGWDRGQYADEAGVPWVNPSPNITGVDCALLYAGTCLFEATNLSEGRGTTTPLQVVGAPWLDHGRLARRVNGLGLPGLAFRPVTFTPWTGKYQGEICRGVQFHVLDRRAARPVEAGLRVLEAIREEAGERFEWRPGINGAFGVDRLTGSDLLRRGETQAYYAACAEGAERFREIRAPYLLY